VRCDRLHAAFHGKEGVDSSSPSEQLDALYRNHGQYVSAVTRTDTANVQNGFILRADEQENQREAAHSSVGKH
jgi:hypothetical protein